MKNWGQELKKNISKLFTEENFYSHKWAFGRACPFTDDRAFACPPLLDIGSVNTFALFFSQLLQTSQVNKDWTYPLPYLPFLFFF